jgi:hypothetical protein
MLRADLRRQRRRAVGVAGAVALCIAVLTAGAGLAFGVYRGTIEPLIPRLPVGVFEVSGRRVDVGILSFGGLGSRLDRAAVDRIRSIEGVVEAHPVTSSDVPMRAYGGEAVLGRRVHTDLFAVGVPPELVREELGSDFQSFKEIEDRVPALISPRLLALYNQTVAPAIEKPGLSPEAVKGLQFEILLGRSATEGSTGRPLVREVAEVVGLSQRASLGGITVPQAVVDRWDGAFDTESPVTSIWVRVEPPERTREVLESIEQAGFRVDEGPKLASWALAVALGLGGGAVMVGAALAAAVSGLTFTLVVAERRTEIAVLRSLGARRRDVARWIGSEALLLGAVGGAVGVGLGCGLGFGVAAALEGTFAASGIPVQGWFRLPPWAVFAGVGLGALSSWVGAWVPARRAAALDPALALRS